MLAAPVCRQLLSNVIRSISGGNIPTDAKRPKSRKELRLMHYFQAVRFSSSFSDPTQTGPSGSRDNLFKSPLLTKTMRKDTTLDTRKVDGFHNKLMGDAKRQKLKFQFELPRNMRNADTVLWIAFGANLADTCIKGFVAYMTGSKSILAETVHNSMDTLNQGILILGSYYSKKKPDSNHPYGYGNSRYIASLISGVGILAFGCGVSIFNGINGLMHPQVLESLYLAYMSLGLSACFQMCSFTAAFRQLWRSANEAHESIFDYLRNSADPTLSVILCEDAAALTGVCIAFGAVSLSHLFSSPFFDSVGSILIGSLLGAASVYIIRANATNLLGRSLPERRREQIVRMLKNDFVIKGVHDVKATSVGVNKYSFKAEIDYGGREITRAYLRENCDMKAMLDQISRIKDETEMEAFMVAHGEKIVDRIGDEVDRIETNIKRSNPDIRHIDLEPS